MFKGLTKADIIAIGRNDSDYILEKGVKYYNDPDEPDYPAALEYYRLAAAMGNTHAVSNLGYCYMYGRGVKEDIPLAIEYFRIAAANDDVDALYKLGNIYGSGKYGVEKDPETAVYYYQKAAYQIGRSTALDYPSLFLSLGKEHMPGGFLTIDMHYSYKCLQLAKKGYELLISEGADYYQSAYMETVSLLEDPFFDPIKLDTEKDDFQGSGKGKDEDEVEY